MNIYEICYAEDKVFLGRELWLKIFFSSFYSDAFEGQI
jgi:hypothetical protein